MEKAEKVLKCDVDRGDTRLDYNVISDDLMTVLQATINKIEREWPDDYKHIDSARELILVTTKLAINTFHTILYICADKPDDPKRERRFCLSVPPLSRTILESLLTLLFVLEDLPKYSSWFYKSGYREWAEALERYETEYGDAEEWKPFIDKLRRVVSDPPAFLSVSADEKAEPKKLAYWPNPGRMVKLLEKDHPGSSAITHMKYLNDWYYRQLSGQTHLNVHGLSERGLFFSPREVLERLFGSEAESVVEREFSKYRNDQVWTALMLTLALVSEIELHFGFELAERLKYLWALIGNYSDYANDLYARRYSSL